MSVAKQSLKGAAFTQNLLHSMMKALHYVFGPKLYMEYKTSAKEMYVAVGLEKLSDQILNTLSLMWNIGYYSSPFLVTLLYRRGYLATDYISSYVKFTTSIGLIYVLSICMRALGRSRSPSYMRFVKALELVNSPKTIVRGKRALASFDFDFSAWKVDFNMNNVNGTKEPLSLLRNREICSYNLVAMPCHIAAYIAMHTFGIRIIYPGSVRILQSLMSSVLVTGRAKLIEEENAIRFKLKTIDDNHIDSIFVDQRKNNPNGSTLVICSEGNAGFYEIGIMVTPLALKYSVLGWNHPGFAGSTGTPYPDQDKNAIDTVIQFAIHQLGFSVENIILYGWSIGGYTTLWAATTYPDVKGVVLDATFDDIMHLAVQYMPKSLGGIVKIAVRNYCNLNNIEMIPHYNGPVLLIRRTEDEIIAKDKRVDTNRGNFLSLAFLKYRYPHIYRPTVLREIQNLLSNYVETRIISSAEDELFMSALITHVSDQGKFFPMQIGEDYTEERCYQMALFLLRKHFRDFKSTHCSPLPIEYFNTPWDIPAELGFDFT